MLAIRNNCCFEGKVHYVSTQHLVGSTCDGLQRRIMESSQRRTTKSRLGAARLWGLHPLLWRHLNTPLLVFLERISSHLMAYHHPEDSWAAEGDLPWHFRHPQPHQRRSPCQFLTGLSWCHILNNVLAMSYDPSLSLTNLQNSSFM